MCDSYIIGIDPDSKAHGVALYKNGELIALQSLQLLDLQCQLISEFCGDFSKLVVHMEDNNAVSAAYGARDSRGTNLAVKLKMAQYIGNCKQAQIELERLFERLNVKVVKCKQSKQWKNDKESFQRATGWTGRSNEDTRSAAWFGWCGVRDSKLIKREAK